MHDATIRSPALGYHVNPIPDDVGLAEIFSALRRRAWILAAVVIPVMAIVALALTMLTPRYTAEVLIMIEADGTSNIVSLDSVVTGLTGDSESVQSEAYVLSSRALADRVIQKLELVNDQELTAELTTRAGSGLSAVAYSQLIERFMDRLTVLPLEDSRVIRVQFRSEDPEKAATITNTLAEEYLQSRLENKYELTQRASAWLSRRIDELRSEVAQAEAAVERARRQFGFVQGDGLTLATQELVEVNTQLVLARTQRTEAEARLQEVNRLLRTASGATAATEVLGSNLIQRLREQQAEVQRRVAELSSELGDKHPRMIQLRAEADDLNARIDGEIGKIVSGLRNQVNVARAREAALQRRLDELKDRAATANESDIEVRALEREAEANRSLLNNLLARQKETLSQDELGFQQPDASIFSPAGVPAEPSFPKPALMLGLGFIGSLVIALLVILIVELLDSGFRSGEQFEQATGVPSIGFVPLTKRPADYQTMAGYAAGRPGSAFSEAVRTLNWSLTLAFPDSPPRVVLITSALPGEGKTTIASTLATIQCNAGQKVALIDADIRRPGCHEILGVDREPGLTNLLAGELTLDEALASSEWSQLKVIPAGTRSAHASNLLGSRKMAELIRELAHRFDMVVIDSPPLLAAADARILSRIADATVLIVRWGKTRRQVVKLATRQLETAGARLAGGLLSMVDVRRNAKYSYGDSGAYSGDLEKYYAG